MNVTRALQFLHQCIRNKVIVKVRSRSRKESDFFQSFGWSRNRSRIDSEAVVRVRSRSPISEKVKSNRMGTRSLSQMGPEVIVRVWSFSLSGLKVGVKVKKRILVSFSTGVWTQNVFLRCNGFVQYEVKNRYKNLRLHYNCKNTRINFAQRKIRPHNHEGTFKPNYLRQNNKIFVQSSNGVRARGGGHCPPCQKPETTALLPPPFNLIFIVTKCKMLR